jgi:aminoglycoside/choline kinase family phosphotransferase
MTRAAEIGAFLAATGWHDAHREPLAGDASARRYERLHGQGCAMLMDVPPESGLVVGPFLAVAAWLRAGGFSAPAVLASDPDRGLVLLEDLGDDLFARICAAAPEREPGLYAAAVDLLADLQRRPPPNGSWTPPPYDMAVLMREARLVVEWYLPAASGCPVPADLAAEFDALAEAAFAPVASARATAVLRDYHAENLIWLPDRPAHARVGMLDFQDMLIGHPAYDLVSLLEDARRDTSPELRAAMLARYLARSGADPAAFVHAAHVLATQRNLKILGLFTRLCRRDGKPRYLAYLPRVWAHLARDLAHPELAPLARFVARHVPPPESALLARIEAPA